MVIANMSSIFLSLNTSSLLSIFQDVQPRVLMSDSSITTQVKLLSLVSTIWRLVLGPLADFVAPVPVVLRRAEQPAAGSQDESPSGGSPHELGDVDTEEGTIVSAKPKAVVYYAFPRKHYISRISFFFGASLLLMFTFLVFLAINTNGQSRRDSMSLLTAGVAIAYGTSFTVL
jgi:hypothetical protein